ncbi:MAG: hypothetical protein P8I03_14420 [Thalassotalea sp.]|nr:hypothetical protein [Thalassotalea sp.]
MSAVRNPSAYLIEKYKAAGYDVIHPASCVRFVQEFVTEMPKDWQNLDRESLIKKVREHCERSASGKSLNRKRSKEVSGYIYQIVS